MKNSSLLHKKNISIAGKAIFKKLPENNGRVPIFYKALTFFRDSFNCLLAFQYGQELLNSRQKTVINLIIRQVNQNQYSLAANIQIGGVYDFIPEQILEIRNRSASFDPNIDPLVKPVKEIPVYKGVADPLRLENYFAAGYTVEHLTDCILTIGEITMASYMYSEFKFSFDFKARGPSLD
ncbi:hypothetical protein [Mucilaginibacter sp.]|uniref:hypothetical protein n=1 Tax=Mucilaginibacter sp. TaxID=1882438 RepID=UPI00261BDC6F|nr:hypothetical protein [Mucilaginibacter sp.]MDB4926752.1 alkylhydroperoxidase like protein AhpD family [Mucilaginibacter sp.]